MAVTLFSLNSDSDIGSERWSLCVEEMALAKDQADNNGSTYLNDWEAARPAYYSVA